MGLMPYVRPKYLDNNSVLANGYQLFFYIAGTTTKQNTFSDTALTVANPNPIILNARGEPDNTGTPIDIYLTPGLSYKVVLATDTDTDPPATPVWTVDNVTDASGGGGAGSSGQWLASNTAVYVNATTFKISGVDLTTDYHKGRKVWLSGGNNRYATIFTSSFAIDTTVTLVDIQDSTGAPAVLDPVMTDSALSIQRVDADHAIHWRFYPGTDNGVTNFEFPIGDLRRYGALMDDSDDTAAFISCVAAVPSGGSLLVPDGIAVVQPVTTTKPINFIGTGTLKLQANSNVTLVTVGTGADGTTIRDITLDANRAAQTTEAIALSITVAEVSVQGAHVHNGLENIEITGANAKNIQIHDCHIEGHNTDGVTVKTLANNISIQGNTIKEGSYGVRVLGGIEVTIAGNTVLDYSTGGIVSAYSGSASDKVTINNNHVSNVDTAFTANAISVLSSNNTLITNNVIDKSKDTGITVERSGVDPIPDGFLITENTIIESVESNIYIGEANFGIIDNNSIQSNGISKYGIRTFGTGSGGITNTFLGTNLIGAVTILALENLGGATVVFNNEYIVADVTLTVPPSVTRATIIASGGGGGGGGGGDGGTGSGTNGATGSDTTITHASTVTTVITAKGGAFGGAGTSGGVGAGGLVIASFVTLDAVQITETTFNGEDGDASPGITNPAPAGKGGSGLYGIGGIGNTSSNDYHGIRGAGGAGGWGQDGAGAGGGASTCFVEYSFDVVPGETLVIVIGAGGLGGAPFAAQGNGGDGGDGCVIINYN